jgi:multidrug resistance efflux pump
LDQRQLYTVNIADDTLVAPPEGRIQYRIANVGEVVPAGGKVFTMLDISYVYMDIYLPTEQAGKVKFGADSRMCSTLIAISQSRPRCCSSPRGAIQGRREYR